MKVFQILHKYDAYIPHFEAKYDVSNMSFEEHRNTLINDRFYALHILKPALDNTDEGFYTMWDYEGLQIKWAEERGMAERDLKKILFAQIEEVNPDVLYSGSPLSFEKDELDKNLSPSIIRVCWSASPIKDGEKFKNYQTRLTNLPLDIKSKSEVGFRNDLFQPAFDPYMEKYAENDERPIDLFFYGQYADEYFKNRNRQIDKLLEFKKNSNINIEISLQYRIKRTPIKVPILGRYVGSTYPSKQVRDNASPPIYGLDLYEKLSQSKIAYNAGVDFSENYKVNMRNFEVLGCGAHMLSDVGIYPEYFEMNKHFSTYTDIGDCIDKIQDLVRDKEKRELISTKGNQMVRSNFSKEKQWEDFQKIVASL